MNLQHFVSQALIEIHRGVHEANNAVSGLCPQTVYLASRPEEWVLAKSANGKPQAFQFVEFDIALTASRDEGGKAGIGVVSWGLGAGVDTRSANEQVSRVKFKVPLVLPADLPEQPERTAPGDDFETA